LARLTILQVGLLSRADHFSGHHVGHAVRVRSDVVARQQRLVGRQQALKP
jgi:hypothetical protein